jgi:hypothetical protein
MHYRVETLGPERVRQAFSLVQAANPGLSFEAWRRFARARVERPGMTNPTARKGILCLDDPRGCILALFAFHAEPDFGQGSVLHCDYLAAVDMLNPRQALSALIAGFLERAKAAGCRTIRVAAPRALGALSAALVDRGFGVEWIGHGIALDDKPARARPKLRCV